MSARARKSYRTGRPYAALDDAQQQALLDEARNGAKTAQEALIECQRSWLMGWSERHLDGALGQVMEADDVVQEVLLRAWLGKQSCAGATIGQFRG